MDYQRATVTKAPSQKSNQQRKVMQNQTLSMASIEIPTIEREHYASKNHDFKSIKNRNKRIQREQMMN